jgi:predicted nucleotidyltransferase
MSEEILYPDTPVPLAPALVLLGRRGSEAHGTFVPSTDPNSIDDRDLMGVCIPPEPWTLGLKQWEGAEAFKECWDVVLYDFRKFVRLLCKQNPNVIGMLWLEPEDYLHVWPAGRMLIENRHLFRDAGLAYDSFVGYAHGQLRRMTHFAFKGYMGEKRKKLVEKYGYDCKNAAHLVRLLHMGEEYLRTGVMHVKRTWDRDMLIQIKTGGWPLDRVQAYADDLFVKMRDAKEKAVIPSGIDEDAVNDLVVSVMRAALAVPSDSGGEES